MITFTQQINNIKNAPKVVSICKWVDYTLGIYEPNIYYKSSDGTAYIEFLKLDPLLIRLRVSQGRWESRETPVRWNISSIIPKVEEKYSCYRNKNFYGYEQLNQFVKDFMMEIKNAEQIWFNTWSNI